MLYRDPLTSNAQLVAGGYAGRRGPGRDGGGGGHPADGRAVRAAPGEPPADEPRRGPITLVRHRDRAGTRPRLDLLDPGPEPARRNSTAPAAGRPYWVGGVFADPGQLAAMQNAFSGPGMELNWEFPLAVERRERRPGAGAGQRAQPRRHGDARADRALTASADTLTVTSPLISDLSVFLTTQAAIQTVLLLLFVSLIVVGAAVILLAARMIVRAGTAELTMLRARGGSLRQVAAVMLRAAVLAAVPAAADRRGAWPSPLVPGGAVVLARPAGGWPGSRSRSRWRARR